MLMKPGDFDWPRMVRAWCVCTLWLSFAVVEGWAAADGGRIVARVNEEPVFAEEVERELRAAYGQDVKVAQAGSAVWQRAAEQVVNRRLVLAYLTETKQAASQQDVDFALEQLRNELKAQGVTMQEYSRRGGWREEDFRRHLTWTLSWQRFLEQRLAEPNLQKFFERNRPDFDGREVRVAHLLLKVDAADETGRAQALKRVAEILAEIESGKLTFEEAVKKHSQAPTAAAGGGLGFIRRREPMPESFSKAALWLEKGQVSQPVVTAFGVHLIQCKEIRPGKLTWRDSEAELRKAVALYLFDWSAEKQRAKTKVEWTKPAPVGVAGRAK